MKTNHPSLITGLLLSATHSVRRLFTTSREGLAGAHADILFFRPEQSSVTDDEREACFLLDALIHPAAPDVAWQPGNLSLFPSEGGGAGLCRLLDAEVLESRRFQTADDRTCIGTRRVRLRVAVRPGLKRLCFRHRDTLFGSVVLP